MTGALIDLGPAPARATDGASAGGGRRGGTTVDPSGPSFDEIVSDALARADEPARHSPGRDNGAERSGRRADRDGAAGGPDRTDTESARLAQLLGAVPTGALPAESAALVARTGAETAGMSRTARIGAAAGAAAAAGPLPDGAGAGKAMPGLTTSVQEAAEKTGAGEAGQGAVGPDVALPERAAPGRTAGGQAAPGHAAPEPANRTHPSGRATGAAPLDPGASAAGIAGPATERGPRAADRPHGPAAAELSGRIGSAEAPTADLPARGRPAGGAAGAGEPVPGGAAAATAATGTPATGTENAGHTAAPAPTTAVTASPATAPAAATPAPATMMQPELATQLAQLRVTGDGNYQLRVGIHPAELGAVDVTASIRGGHLTVLIHADSAAHQAVSQALAQLKDFLAQSGFAGVDVSLGDPGTRPGDRDDSGDRDTGSARGDGREDTAAVAETPGAGKASSISGGDRGLNRWL